MRHFLLFFSFAVLFFTACTKDDHVAADLLSDQDGIVTKSTPTEVECVEVRESPYSTEFYFVDREMAEDFISLTFADNAIVSVSEMQDGMSLVYLFDLERGWALVSSDTRTQPILAYSEQGSIDPESFRSGPMAGWYQLVCDEQAS